LGVALLSSKGDPRGSQTVPVWHRGRRTRPRRSGYLIRALRALPLPDPTVRRTIAPCVTVHISQLTIHSPL